MGDNEEKVVREGMMSKSGYGSEDNPLMEGVATRREGKTSHNGLGSDHGKGVGRRVH